MLETRMGYFTLMVLSIQSSGCICHIQSFCFYTHMLHADPFPTNQVALQQHEIILIRFVFDSLHLPDHIKVKTDIDHMEAEGTLMPSTDDQSTNGSFARRQPSKSDFSDDTASPSSKPCFDCSICLDFAADPVVTLCGHLYCWPCIYKWIQIGTSQHDCPVCKSPLSPNSLVPLYGRGATSKNATTNKKCVEIPDRPAFSRNAMPTPNRSTRQDYHHPSQWGGLGVLNPTVGGVFGGLVVAILPLVSRSGGGNGGGGGEMNFMRVNQVAMVGSRERERRVEDSLHQIWMFFFSCVVLWWLFF